MGKVEIQFLFLPNLHYGMQNHANSNFEKWIKIWNFRCIIGYQLIRVQIFGGFKSDAMKMKFRKIDKNLKFSMDHIVLTAWSSNTNSIFLVSCITCSMQIQISKNRKTNYLVVISNWKNSQLVRNSKLKLPINYTY